MISEPLLTHIRSELARGKSRGDIAPELLKVGWKVEDINEALKIIDLTHRIPYTPFQSELDSPKTNWTPAIVLTSIILLVGGALVADYYNFNSIESSLNVIDSNWKALVNPAPPGTPLKTVPSGDSKVTSATSRSTTQAPSVSHTHTPDSAIPPQLTTNLSTSALALTSLKAVDCMVVTDGAATKISSTQQFDGSIKEVWEQKYRVTTQSRNGGRECPTLISTYERTAGEPVKPSVDCVVAVDGAITKISSTVQTDGSAKEVWEQKYKITTEPANGGVACPALSVKTERIIAAVPSSPCSLTSKDSSFVAAVHQVWNKMVSLVTRNHLAQTPCPEMSQPSSVTWVKAGGWYESFVLYQSATVRFMPDGATKTLPADSIVTCADWFFGVQWIPGTPVSCEVSSASALVKRPTTSGVVVDNTKLMAPAAGFSDVRIRPSSDTPRQTNSEGAFRAVCHTSHMNFDDVLVYPNQPSASHLHVYFGAVGTNANSTTDSILNAPASTCNGGLAYRSSGWMPAIIDTATGVPQVPEGWLNYYKEALFPGFPDIVPIPRGLRLISGNFMSTTGPVIDSKVGFSCNSPAGEELVKSQSIPACAPGNYIVAAVGFPRCWNGQLDSPDHRSHVVHMYAVDGTHVGCPPSHPQIFPDLALRATYRVPPGADTTKWRLSSDMYSNAPGGYSLHADYIAGWDDDVQAKWIAAINSGLDLHANLLGDGTEIYGN